MFASATSSNTYTRQAGAYQQMHVSTGVTGATPHGLVTMLFDGFVDSVSQARGAMRSGNIEAKGRAIGRAVSIVNEGLKGTLNLRDGGKLAADLDGLYGYITLRLTHANLRNDEAALVECNQLIEPVRSAWAGIADKATT